jgi:mono/diheme cytochrome c family protein
MAKPDSQSAHQEKGAAQAKPVREYDVEALHQQDLHEGDLGEPNSSMTFPLPLVVAFLVIGFVAGAYLFKGGGTQDVAGAAGAEEEEELTLVEEGERLFSRNCAACHQGNGQGIAGQFPPLAGSRWVTSGPKVPTLIVLHGLQGPIEVKGNVYRSAMAPLGNLSNFEVSAILTYVRQAWGNEAPEVTEAEVAAVRSAYPSDHPQWTAEELMEIGLDAPAEGGAPAEGDTAAAATDAEPGT